MGRQKWTNHAVTSECRQTGPDSYDTFPIVETPPDSMTVGELRERLARRHLGGRVVGEWCVTLAFVPEPPSPRAEGQEETA